MMRYVQQCSDDSHLLPADQEVQVALGGTPLGTKIFCTGLLTKDLLHLFFSRFPGAGHTHLLRLFRYLVTVFSDLRQKNYACTYPVVVYTTIAWRAV